MKNRKSVTADSRRLTGGLAVLGCLAPISAVVAQQPIEPPMEEVIVTATGTAIRGVAPVGSATLSVSQEDILNSVSVDTTQIIRDLPQGSGLANQEVQNTGGNVGFAQGINLRGLGNNATLVLFDGHRLVGQGVTAQFADPNQLPMSAIQRVEVVMDAASAIYGSDAVAGVVNFVLRDDFDGFQVNLRQTDALYDATAVDMLGGMSWDTGNFWVGVMYEDRGTFRRNESRFLFEDQRPLGGDDLRNNRPGPLPQIVANGTVYGVPATNGAVPTAADVLALEGQQTISDLGDEQDFWPERERLAVSFRARQDLFDGRGQFTFTGIYSERESEISEFNTFRTTTVRPDSPYWIDGLTTASSYRMSYSYFHNNQGAGSVPVINNPVEEALNTYFDFVYDINDNWQLKANLTYGDNEGCGRCGKRMNNAFADAGYRDSALDPLNYSDIFNPFLQGPQTEFMSNVFFQQDQRTWFEMRRMSVGAEGGLFDMGGGSARLAIGIDYEETEQKLFLDGFGRFNPPRYFVLRDAFAERDLSAAYAELYLPFSDRFEMNVAVRHDDYSDFGSTTNPRIAFNFDATDSITIRATAAEAFRAPTLVETNPSVLEQIRLREYTNDGSHDIPVTNPARGVTAVIDRIGNTPGLQPETAEVWSFGLDFAPAALDGLRFSATYYDVTYENRIEGLPNQPAAIGNSMNRSLYSPYVIAAPQPTTCVADDVSTWNPLYDPYTSSPNFGVGAQAAIDECDLQAIILGGTQNTGALQQSGLDLQVSYNWDTNVGQMGIDMNTSKVLDLKRSLLPGGEDIDNLDRIGFQNSLRSTLRFTWRNDRWTGSVDAMHVGSYTNDLPVTIAGQLQPPSEVPSWTTLGANLTYEPGSLGNGFMDGVRIGLNIDNLTDKDPPVVFYNNSAVDFQQHNIFGRIWSLTLQKTFGDN